MSATSLLRQHVPKRRSAPLSLLNCDAARAAGGELYAENCVTTAKRSRRGALYSGPRSKDVVPHALAVALYEDRMGADGWAHCACCSSRMLWSAEEVSDHKARTNETVAQFSRGHMTAELSGDGEPDGPTVWHNMLGVCLTDQLHMGVTDMMTFCREKAEKYPDSVAYTMTAEKEALAKRHKQFLKDWEAIRYAPLRASESDPRETVRVSDGLPLADALKWSEEETAKLETLWEGRDIRLKETDSWAEIANQIGRSDKACSSMWKRLGRGSFQ